MSIFDRSSLDASSLADLHAIASELSIDGYRRLRKADLIDAILARQGPAGPPETPPEPEARPTPASEPETPPDTRADQTDDAEGAAPRRRRGRRGGRGRSAPSSVSEDAS